MFFSGILVEVTLPYTLKMAGRYYSAEIGRQYIPMLVIFGISGILKKFFSLAGMWIISFAEPFRRYGKKENVDNKGGMLKNEKTRAVGVGILAALLFLCVFCS